MNNGRSTSDFIVVVLVLVVACILVAFTATAIGLAIFTDEDVGPFVAAIINLTATVIAALVGFLAGRHTNGNGPGKEHP